MIPEYKEKSRTNPPCELRLGIASWAKGDESMKSVKFTWFDKNGKAARGGEFPVEALAQALEFAIRKKYVRLANDSAPTQEEASLRLTIAFLPTFAVARHRALLLLNGSRSFHHGQEFLWSEDLKRDLIAFHVHKRHADGVRTTRFKFGEEMMDECAGEGHRTINIP